MDWTLVEDADARRYRFPSPEHWGPQPEDRRALVEWARSNIKSDLARLDDSGIAARNAVLLIRARWLP